MSQRKRSHYKAVNKGSDYLFHKALRKYGVDAFEWSILYDGFDSDDLDVLERRAIEKHNGLVPDGYNLREGGTNGYRHSEETRNKIRDKARARATTPEGRLHLVSNGRLIKGKKRTPDKYGFLGKRHTEESKNKMRDSAIVANTPEVRAKKSASLRQAFAKKPRRAKTELEKENLRNKMRLQWQDPEYRGRVMAARQSSRLER